MNSEQNNLEASVDGQSARITNPQVKPAPEPIPFSIADIGASAGGLAPSHQSTNYKSFGLAWIVLTGSLMATAVAAFFMKMSVEADAKAQFNFVCREINARIGARMDSHAQLLRSASAIFGATEEVTRERWHAFTARQKIDQHLPGIQGIGFSLVVPRDRLAQHTQEIRSQGFPDYTVRPEGDRETYTSIIYIEPFSGRNLRVFGYDMFSEPVRRKAMERARDLDAAILSGKVTLVQETGQDVQVGTLMYVPVYRKGMPTDTVEQRRSALYGWAYSPYRMNDLMEGISKGWDLEAGKRIRLQVFDNERLSPDSLLYDSQPKGEIQKVNGLRLTIQTSITTAFDDHLWSLRFTQTKGHLDQALVYGVLSGGTIVSLLLFGLSRSLLNIQARKQTDIALKQAHEELEQRVAVRTEELRRANGFLQAEIIEHKHSDDAVRNSLREKESLLKEIHHRVKNNLQIVSSLLRLQSAQIDNPIGKAAMQDMQNRVRSMAIIHEHLYRSENFSQVDMSAYIQTLCHKLMQAMVVRPDAILLHLDMVPVHLEIDQAIPCGLLLNELVCNSFKHAFPQGRKGEVRVELRPVDEGRQIHLRVSDNGVGLPADFDIKHLNSLGLELASDLASQIRGRLEIGPGPGATFDVVFTLGNRMESTRKSGDTEMRRKENA